MSTHREDPIAALQKGDARFRRMAIKATRFATQELHGTRLQQFTQELSEFLRKYVPVQEAEKAPDIGSRS